MFDAHVHEWERFSALIHLYAIGLLDEMQLRGIAREMWPRVNHGS